MPNGGQHQQRPNGVPLQPGQMQPSGPQAANANGVPQQARGPVRNGPLAPQVNGQGIPQAQMQARAGPNQHPNMQMARNPQYSAQQFQMANGNMPSPGSMPTQPQLAQNQAALAAAYPQQQPQSSPSMPPPPTPQGAQQLSSGATPLINTIKTQLRAANPNMAQDQLDQLANQQLMQKYTSQARQNAMNAAAGVNGQGNASMQQFPHNQAAYQGNRQMPPNGLYANVNGGGVNAEGNGQTSNMNPPGTSPQTQQQQAYQKSMQQQQYSAMRMQQMQMQQSPSQAHVSPAQSHPSPSIGTTPASPSLQQYPNMNGGMVQGMNGQTQQRPTSRSNTPQMQRVGSSGSGINGGMQSPGALQGSPRNVQANMARS